MTKKAAIPRLLEFFGIRTGSDCSDCAFSAKLPATAVWTKDDAAIAAQFMATPAGRKLRDRCRNAIGTHLPTFDPSAYANPYDAGFNGGYASGASDILTLLEYLPSDDSLKTQKEIEQEHDR